MKAIPKDDFIKIVSQTDCEVIFEDELEDLFKLYGDDWFINRDYYGEWELCKENKLRKEIL